MNTNLPVVVLKGIGDKKSKLLDKMGIRTIENLLNYYPRDYERNMPITKISEIIMDEINVIEGTVCFSTQNIRKSNMVLTKTKIRDNTGEIFAIWFSQPYLKNKLKIGAKYVFKGKIQYKYNIVQISSPEIIEINKYSERINHLKPIYPLIKDISMNFMTSSIKQAIDYTKNQLKEFLPNEVREKYNLAEYNYSIRQIHNPDNYESLETAKKRLIFDEFLLFALGINLIKEHTNEVINEFNINDIPNEKKLIESLPYNLTGAQQKVWKEIKDELKSNKAMNRLVQGDVGSGKTIIAALALLYVADNNYQACMMAPTEVLAKQHYNSITKILNPMGVSVELLVGSMTKKQKDEIYKKLKNGEISILIGTHTLIQEKVEFNNLALAITDEQHRFGVKQRENLSDKGKYPHILVMSATPIPRTLALIIYSDMDVSIIDEMPPGRQKIETYAVNTSYRQRIYSFIEGEINNGRQVYIICPMVEDSETLELESVISYTEKIKERIDNKINVEYMHGKMKAKEKNDIMERFSNNEIDILVSTTVIEVGVNVPNATLMIIENAERFGLAGLHQLRGRVGRGKYKSYCILITDSKNTVTKKRMDIMCNYTDGFVISEYDLKLRGPGDVFGLKQHGLPEFIIGDIFRDINILKEANGLAKQILSSDKYLESENNKYLNHKMKRYFTKRIEQVSL
ncbi:ATP-dependent DNA helicase RecG [Vallitalea sp.]|jgi:ATP-dependent DNA helicase RecG|uniref:ATP-dependent DNA helicase RecG n=1 Tax=Vallitalea sp. TaxID=1882829 RepID=UPI0025DB98D0|nr:ATP-dependent DNA helicase RecG [Vallitalea sp.]MCT4687378.1 ATP-dependent DNA helicase RecG [Vallitalea sp.]